MATGPLHPVLHYLRTFGGAERVGPDDGQLLEQFARGNDAAAFEALVRRHGPMVLGVCRRVLRDRHEAEDAFQATFLLLVRKAGSLRQPELVGHWLHGVAYRTALKAKSLAARRRQRERPLDDWPAPAAADDLAWRDLQPVLDDAVNRLSSKYRAPFVLCYLEGLTNAQAARRLGCPEGTVATRLARARQQLRGRLTKQGVSLAAGSLAALSAGAASAAVPPTLLAGTVRLAAKSAAAGVIPTQVAALTEGVCQAMFRTKLRWLVMIGVVLGSAGTGAAVLSYRSTAAEPADKPHPTRPLPEPRPAPPAVPRAEAEPPVTVRSANFLVEAPSRRIAQLVADAAENYRKTQALRWLSKELPAWAEPCAVKVKVHLNGAGGSTTLEFADGQVTKQRMDLEGPLERLLASTLPHEVTHAVLAHHFGEPVPRWADEGAAVLGEDAEDQERHQELARRLPDQPGRAIPLRRLFRMRDYPEDAVALHVQGYSVTRFLVERKDPKTFLAFVKQGMRDGWDKAMQAHYGYRDVEELEDAWLAGLRKSPRPARAAAPAPAANPTRPAPPPRTAEVPSGPPPFMGVASLLSDEEGGTLVLSRWSAECVPIQLLVQRGDGQEEAVATYRWLTIQISQPFRVADVRAFRANGQPVGAKKLPDLLRKEVPVLIAADGQAVDPLHLRLIKDDVLILVPPVDQLQPPGGVPPAAPGRLDPTPVSPAPRLKYEPALPTQYPTLPRSPTPRPAEGKETGPDIRGLRQQSMPPEEPDFDQPLQQAASDHEQLFRFWLGFYQ